MSKYYKEVKVSEELPVNKGVYVCLQSIAQGWSDVIFNGNEFNEYVFIWLKPITKEELLREELEKFLIEYHQSMLVVDPDIDVVEMITEYLS